MIELFVQEWALEVFIFAEILTFGGVLWLFRDSREARKAIYERFDKMRDEYSDKIDGVAGELREAINEARDELRQHEKTCSVRRSSDERWMGTVDEKLSHIERRIG